MTGLSQFQSSILADLLFDSRLFRLTFSFSRLTRMISFLSLTNLTFSQFDEKFFEKKGDTLLLCSQY